MRRVSVSARMLARTYAHTHAHIYAYIHARARAHAHILSNCTKFSFKKKKRARNVFFLCFFGSSTTLCLPASLLVLR